MKLQKLIIHNIASIEDAVIDFAAEPLAGSDVFLITGNTGSGKSTILDAICLALYANTPRLDNTHMQGRVTDGEDRDFSVADPKHLLRRNTGEGYVELTFTGNDGKHYKSKWEVHRKNKKVDGPLQDSSWNLTKLDEVGKVLTKIREIEQKIAEVVGLTFEQFCRTTLLAQGEFTRFLNSNDKEKADILEKITGTDIYKKIGAKIHEIKATKERLLNDATRDIGQITLLSNEEIAEKNTQISACGTRCEILGKERDNANDKLKWIMDEETKRQAFVTANENLTEAKKVVETDQFKAKERDVTQWNATSEARSWLTAQQKAENEKAQQLSNLDALKAYYLKVLAGQAFEEQKRQQKEQQLNALPQVDGKEGENAQKQLTGLRQQLDNAKTLQGNITAAEERINTLNEKKQLRQQAAQSLEDTQKNAKEKERAAKELEQPIKEALQKKNYREEAFNTQKEAGDLLIQLIRQKVQVGDTCPVCHQPIKENLPHEEQLAKLIDDSQKAFKEAKDAYDDLVGKRNKLLAEKKAYEDSYVRAKAAFDKDNSLAEALRRVTAACNACGIETFDENTTPHQLQTLNEKNDAGIGQLNDTIPSLEKTVNAYLKTTKDRTRLTRELGEIQASLNTAKEAIAAILTDRPQWKELHPDAATVSSMEEQKLSRGTQAALIPHTSALSPQPSALTLIKNSKFEIQNSKFTFSPQPSAFELRTKVNTAVTILGTATATAADNQTRLNQFLAEHPEFTRERLVALSAILPADITAKTNEVKAAQNAVSIQEGALKQAKENYENHLKAKPELTEEDTPQQLTLLVAEKEKEMGEVNTEKGRIEKELEVDAQNAKNKGELVKKKELLEAEHNKWDRLNKFIGSASGDAFNKIAQSYILGSLIHSANHYMQNLYDRYTLKVVPGTFVIMIEDAYQGYASRAASTISGGESFLVSLALALALSDIGDRLAVDTLFIDEGFGTLSGAPLQNAITTLRKLHSQSGRHVGIISHIEELKESIATQIQVTPSPNTGSSHIQITTQ